MSAKNKIIFSGITPEQMEVLAKIYVKLQEIEHEEKIQNEQKKQQKTIHEDSK